MLNNGKIKHVTHKQPYLNQKSMWTSCVQANFVTKHTDLADL